MKNNNYPTKEEIKQAQLIILRASCIVSQYFKGIDKDKLGEIAMYLTTACALEPSEVLGKRGSVFEEMSDIENACLEVANINANINAQKMKKKMFEDLRAKIDAEAEKLNAEEKNGTEN